jgi:subtilisin-like proprotein convertase family protein
MRGGAMTSRLRKTALWRTLLRRASLRRSGRSCAVAVALAGLLIGAGALAAAPATVLIQGVLLTKAGGPTTDGLYDMTFTLHAAQSGGTGAWSESTKVVVKGGEFTHALGSIKSIPGGLLGTMKEVWLGATVAKEPELARKKLHAVTFARRAAVADAAGFTYAGSLTKGGPATNLQCTGCVSTSELKIDSDLDMAAYGLKAKTVAANTVAATTFLGDGSKLTGIKIPSGGCKIAGQVVKGIKPDGTLDCVVAMDPTALPADGLDDISNKLLTNQFIDVVDGGVVPIQDNNPTGVSDKLVLPDLGLAQKLDVVVALTNSDIASVTVWLFDPDNTKYVLYEKAGKGTKLAGTWPSNNKTVSGDLTKWVGKNPKGTWRLQIIDTGFKDNKFDGQVDSWSVSVKTLSSKKVAATGNLIVQGALKLPVKAKEPLPCNAANLGYMWVDSGSRALKICNGKLWHPINLVVPDGSKDNPAKTCDAIKKVYTASKSGTYYLDPDGPDGLTVPFEAHCDMTTMQGGWTQVMNVHPADGSSVSFSNTTFWQTNSVYGSYAKHFTNDYKGPMAWLYNAKAIMVQVVEPGVNGKIIGWKAWSLKATKTFDSFFDSSSNTTQTASVLGANVKNVYAYEAVIKNGSQLQSNRMFNPNNDRVRLGVNGYSAQGDDNQPGLGTMMNQSSGNNTYRYKDVELWVNSTANVWCQAPGKGSFKWIGTDGGCGGNCGNCDSKASPPYSPYWVYRIYVR